jgi:hypothetical protein
MNLVKKQKIQQKNPAGTRKCDPICLILGGMGAFMASLAELTAKREVSTILRVKEAVNSYLEIPIAPIYVILFFTILGVILTFASQTDDFKKALYVGASIITIFMTIVPNDLPPSPGGTNSPSSRGSALQRYLSMAMPAYAQDERRMQRMAEVVLTLTTHGEERINEAVITLRDSQSNRLIAQSKYTGDRFAFYQNAGKYLMVIDVPGFKSQTRQITLEEGQTEEIHVELEPTWQPLFLQRIFRAH